MATITQLVKAVCPNFPWDQKKVEVTQNSEEYFRVLFATSTLKVPSPKVLNSPIYLNTFVEAVLNFERMNLNDLVMYDWNNIIGTNYDDPVDAVNAINALNSRWDVEDISVDIESRHAGWEGNRLLAIGFGYKDNHALSVTVFTPEVLQALQNLFNNRSKNFIWQNGKFDTTRLRYMPGTYLEARVDDDVLLMHYIGINEKKGTHGLKEMGPLYLQAPKWDDELDKYKKLYCKKNGLKLEQFTYDLLPKEILIPYLHLDCVATLRLKKVFQEIMRPNSLMLYRKLIEASIAYGQLELNGAKLNVPHLIQMSEDFYDQLDLIEPKVEAAVNHFWDPLKFKQETGSKSLPTKFNMKSPKQLKWLLETATGLKLSDTSADTIDALVEDYAHKPDSPAKDLLSTIGELRKINKYIDTYITGLQNVLCGDGRIRATYNLHGTETGRLSCTAPNMQNIPRDKRIKNFFRAEDGFVLIQADYSQAELRVLANESNDEFLIGVYQRGEDLHAAMAKKIFGENFTKEDRNKAKTVNFGIAYGRGPNSLVEAFGMSMVEAVKIIGDWFAAAPGVKKYINDKRREPIRGIQCVTPLGFERHFVITSDNLYHVQNESINTPIQSTASYMTMFSLIEITDWIRSKGWEDKVKVIITVHDSIILECIDDQQIIDTVASTCQQIMADVPKRFLPQCVVPFKADIEVGKTWGGLKEWTLKTSETTE